MTDTATPTTPMRLTVHALTGMDQHRATRSEVDQLTATGRRHRRGDLAVCTSPTSDLRVLINPTSGTVVAVWRGARHDGPWRTALAGKRPPRRRQHTTSPTLTRTTTSRS